MVLDEGGDDDCFVVVLFFFWRCFLGREEKVVSAVGLDNSLLLASVVWLNIVKKKK